MCAVGVSLPLATTLASCRTDTGAGTPYPGWLPYREVLSVSACTGLEI